MTKKATKMGDFSSEVYEVMPMSKERVELELERLRVKLATQFGVTIQTDHSGAWGRAGITRLVLRNGDVWSTFELTQIDDTRESRADLRDRQCPK